MLSYNKKKFLYILFLCFYLLFGNGLYFKAQDNLLNESLNNNILKVDNDYYYDTNLPESDHPYNKNSIKQWFYKNTQEGTSLKIKFSDESCLNKYDQLLIFVDNELYDMKGYVGDEIAGLEIIINSMEFEIILQIYDENDESEFYGFSFDYIEVADELFTYEVINGEAKIISSVVSGDLVIPAYIDNYKVVGIGKGAFQARGLKSVTFPHTIKYIEDQAFFWNLDLEEVYLDSLESWFNIELMGASASPFINSDANDPIDLYVHNELVKNLIVPDEILVINEYSLSWLGIETLDLNNIEEVPSYSCKHLDFLKRLYIGENTVKIGDGAFNYAFNLQEIVVTYSDNLKYWGSDLFACNDKIDFYTLSIDDYLYKNNFSDGRFNLDKINLYTYGNCEFSSFHKIYISDSKEPTCVEEGVKTIYKCFFCNEIVKNVNIIPKLGHNYKDVETLPTCEEQGYITHTCERCSDTYIDSYVTKLGHNMIIDEKVDATCTTTGLTEGSHCSRCDHKVEQTIIPKLGHKPSDWIIDQEATLNLEGRKHKECIMCKEILLEEIIPIIGENSVNCISLKVNEMMVMFHLVFICIYLIRLNRKF